MAKNFKYYSYKDRFIRQTKNKITTANRKLGEEVMKESRFNTPMAKTVQLRGRTTVTPIDNHVVLEWDVPYAQYQERGMRWDGTHVVKHYTEPGTGAHFAENAVKKVFKIKNIQKHYK